MTRFDLSTHERDLNPIGIIVTAIVKFLNLFVTYDLKHQLELINSRPFPVKQGDETEDDFHGRILNFILSYTNQVGQQELLMYSESGQRTLREELSSDPFTKGFVIQRGTANNDLLTNDRLGFSQRTTVTRERTYEQFALTALVWVASFVLSHSKHARTYLNALAGTNGFIPRILLEQLKVTRESQAGNFFLQPVNSFFLQPYLAKTGLNNTVWDFEWLCTQSGVNSFLSFCARLAQYPANYIDMVELNEIISFNSGLTTTAMAFSLEQVEPVTTIATSVSYTKTASAASADRSPKIDGIYTITSASTSSLAVKVLPNNSYSNKLNLVHLTDAFIWGRVYYTDLTLTTRYFVGSFSPSLAMESQAPNFALYIVQRVTSLKNDLPRKRDTARKTDDDSSTRADRDARASQKSGNGLDIKPKPGKNGITAFSDRHLDKLATILLTKLLRYLDVNTTHKYSMAS